MLLDSCLKFTQTVKHCGKFARHTDPHLLDTTSSIQRVCITPQVGIDVYFETHGVAVLRRTEDNPDMSLDLLLIDKAKSKEETYM